MGYNVKKKTASFFNNEKNTIGLFKRINYCSTWIDPFLSFHKAWSIGAFYNNASRKTLTRSLSRHSVIILLVTIFIFVFYADHVRDNIDAVDMPSPLSSMNIR